MKFFVRQEFAGDFIFSSLWERSGARGQGKNPVPRFRRRNAGGKNPDGQGFKSGDFFASSAKKYYSPLDGLDRRNGAKCRLLFVIGYGIIFLSTNR